MSANIRTGLCEYGFNIPFFIYVLSALEYLLLACDEFICTQVHSPYTHKQVEDMSYISNDALNIQL